MKYLVLSVWLACMCDCLSAQNSRLFAEVHYGPQANFFFQGYDEQQVADMGGTAFLKKNMIGKIGGFDIAVRIGKRSSLGFTYSRSENSKTVSYSNPVNGVDVDINDFTIRHVNKLFQLYYSFDFRKTRSAFSIQPGLFYVRPYQQEIEIIPSFNSVIFDERSFKNSSLEEAGAFLGLLWSHKIDTRFSLGIKSRLYYAISTNTIDLLSVTPCLQYQF